MNRPRMRTVLVLALLLGAALAAPAAADEPAQQGGDGFTCITCHGNPGLMYEFPSGENWPLYVDEQAFQSSMHGEAGLECRSCHPDITGYPHDPIAARSVREYELTQYRACADSEGCHAGLYEASLDSVHGQLLEAGNQAAPVCTDCHGSHYVTAPNQPRTKIPEACAQCHAAIYDQYLTSVHGAALVDNDNQDVPTCTDCHGVHNQEDPRTAEFRLNSPNLCAKCHADEKMMAKYGLSTNVFQTYVDDFHGTTVTMFQRQSPDVPTNKAVCYDCHGVHNMQSASDPNSPIFRENLLENCRQCHPDADANFPASWLSHYEPRIDKYPLVFLVKLFYMILIPAVLGFMGAFVVLDAGGKLARRVRKSRKSNHGAEE